METIKIYKDGRGGCKEVNISLEEAWRSENRSGNYTSWPEWHQLGDEFENAMNADDSEDQFDAIMTKAWEQVDAQGWYRMGAEKVVRVAE